MLGIPESAANYVFSALGVALLFLLLNLFSKLQKNTSDQMDKSFEHIKDIQQTTIDNMSATTILAAGTVGEKIVSGISPGLVVHQNELVKIQETLVRINESNINLKQEIKLELKERYEKNREFNSTEFTKIEGKIDLLLYAKTPPQNSQGNLNVDLNVSEKIPN